MRRHGFEKVHRHIADTLCLLFVDVESSHHSLDRRFSRIALQFAAGKVVQNTVAKRAVSNFHNVNFELIEDCNQNGNTARKHFSAILF